MGKRSAVALLAAALGLACAGPSPDGGAPGGDARMAPSGGAPGPDGGPLGPRDSGGADPGPQARDGGSASAPLDAGGMPASLCAVPTTGGGAVVGDAEPGLSSSCDGVLPTVSQPPGAADFSLGTMGAACRGATSDGRGTVALLLQGSAASNYQPYAVLGDADGGFTREPTAQALAPQPDGFAVVGVHLDQSFGPHDSFFHFSFSAAPPPLVADALDALAVAAVPGGGALVAEQTWNPSDRFLSASRFDAAGHAAAGPIVLAAGPRAARGPMGVAVSTQGEGLVAFAGLVPADDGWIDGAWVKADGSSERAIVRLAQGSPRALLLRPLADGSIAVRADGVWVARARPTGAVEAPPGWLAAHPGSDVFLRASGKGYVVQASGNIDPATSCAPFVELRAPAGNLCAVIGTQGRPALASVGLDGTLFGRVDGMPCEFGNCCHLRWWKGALP